MTLQQTASWKRTVSLWLCALAFALPMLAASLPARASTVVYRFEGQPTDGASPHAGLAGDSAGNGYGTTSEGGAYNSGSVYKITPDGQETVLYSFTGTNGDGQNPQAGVTLGKDGNFYGTTYHGGTDNCGTVYKITPTGQETILHSFTVNTGDGQNPQAGVTLGKDGNFYGTTYWGGAYNSGSVYKITPDGQETVLYSFPGVKGTGFYPYGGVIQAKDGNFYGTTEGGFDNYSYGGTIYKITPTGQVTYLHFFQGSPTDGTDPVGGPIQGQDGNFYGTTSSGGAYNSGTVYKITPDGQETVLYSFGETNGDGYYPYGGVIQAKDGNFYGTTAGGGAHADGTIFKLLPTGQETVLHAFAGKTDGAFPYAPLVQAKNGYLYGTTADGGTTNDIYGDGTIFRIIL